MATYPPNFNDQGIIDLCINSGYPVTVDGFYNAINDATGNTNGSIDDIWRLYITDVLGYTFVGQHPAHYGLQFGDAIGVELPAWWPVAEPLPEIRASGPIWNGAYDLTTDYTYAATAPTINLETPFGSLQGTKSAWVIGFSSASPDAQIDLPRNSYIESATITFTVLHVGASFAGAKLYLKKVQMETSQATNGTETLKGWFDSGYLTTSYVALTTANLAVGDAVIDVKALIEEAMSGATSEWQDTDQILQFVLIPNATSVSNDSYGNDNLVIARTAGGISYEYWTARLNISAIVNTGNYETALTQDSMVAHFMPASAADMANPNSMRSVACSDLIGGRASYTLTPASGAPALPDPAFPLVLDPTDLTLGLPAGVSYTELPPVSWSPEGTGNLHLFGTIYENDPSFAVYGSLQGWLMQQKTRSYIICASGRWEPDATCGFYWDSYANSIPPEPPGLAAYGHVMKITASADSWDTTGLSLRACAGQTGYWTTSNPAQAIPITTAPVAGRKVQLALVWDHVVKRFKWWVRFSDAQGATLEVIEGQSGVCADPSPGPNGGFASYKAGCGWQVSHHKIYGQMITEWQIPVTHFWKNYVANQTALWMRGIKSIDPRIMQ